MGYVLKTKDMDAILKKWGGDAIIFAPVRYAGQSEFSGQDSIRYGAVKSIGDIVFDEKSSFTFKEALLPLCETLFYFTENSVKEADGKEKSAIIFLRSCDLHALRVFDEIYLNSGPADYYYARLRENARFILMGCEKSFRNCFCVDMGTNISQNYDAYIKLDEGNVHVDNKFDGWTADFESAAQSSATVTPDYVTDTDVHVRIPENLSLDVMDSNMWTEYDTRCINCGRCNFSCPTCTCFTMQDIHYTDNGWAGERRRVHASCMVDGFTDVAGGASYRQGNGQRMRFKALHKVYDYKKRFGYHMCVGCGRCDDVCPEYISFSTIINKLEQGMEEVTVNDEK
ncbi:anaerobic sulfite reductase subunit AsrA [Christensenellaceae bacterium OttesenSCG-928-K19]|nr:anaerobic sulfite reductase subunit AsrA [Christensenellaceae bacterium OttesenSCG-928-K19]